MRDLRHMENKVLNLQRECIHWQKKHEIIKELEICEIFLKHLRINCE